MRCRRCGREMHDDWSFCPKCGARRGGDPMDAFGRDLFSQMFGRIRNSFREFDDVDRMFEKDIEALDLSPWFREAGPEKRKLKPRQGKGFTVRISSGTGMEPKVSVQTFGGVDKDKIEKEVEERFGVPAKALERRAQKPKKEVFRLPLLGRKAAPKVTEEPAADVRRIGDRVMVEVKLPGVRSLEDIEVKELESSLEVKAIAGDKAFFKILTKPAEFGLASKTFRDGVLHLEFA